MITEAKPRADHVPAWHADFLKMLPAIQRQASLAFRGLPATERDDLIAEIVANALCAYRRLVERDKAELEKYLDWDELDARQPAACR